MQQRARLRGRLSAVAQTTDADRHQRSEVMIRTLYAEAAQTLTEFFEDARSGRRRPAASVGELGGRRAVHTQATDGRQ